MLAERAEIALQAATHLAAAFELGRRLHAARTRRPKRLRRPRDVADFFSATLGPLVHEELWIAALDAWDGVRGARMVSRGGLVTTSVRPADVLRAALELDAVAFVMAHNPPGGDPTRRILPKRICMAGKRRQHRVRQRAARCSPLRQSITAGTYVNYLLTPPSGWRNAARIRRRGGEHGARYVVCLRDCER